MFIVKKIGHQKVQRKFKSPITESPKVKKIYIY